MDLGFVRYLVHALVNAESIKDSVDSLDNLALQEATGVARHSHQITIS